MSLEKWQVRFVGQAFVLVWCVCTSFCLEICSNAGPISCAGSGSSGALLTLSVIDGDFYVRREPVETECMSLQSAINSYESLWLTQPAEQAGQVIHG